MEISTVDRGACLTPEFATFAHRRLHFALSRFDPKIDRVVLTLNDTNGPRGGVDKQCQIQIFMCRGQDIIVTDLAEDVRTCVARAADRAGRTVARQLERLRDAYRKPRPRIAFGDVL